MKLYFSHLAAVTLLCAAHQAAAVPVDISGGEAEHREAIMDTVPARRLAALDNAGATRFWVRRFPDAARKAMEPFGFYDARVQIEAEGDAVLVTLDPGAPVRVHSVRVSFGDSPVVPDVGFPLQPGQVLNHRDYERGKQAIHAWLLANGYLNTRLEQAEVRVHRARGEAEIELAWRPGPQFSFGAVSFSDNPLNEAFLQRYLPLAKGETYTEAKLQKLSENLRSSGYYGAVEIQPQLPSDGSLEVPLHVVLTPRKRSVYQYGAIYATDAGPGLEAGVERRWVNDKGHTARGQLELASRRSLAALRYEIPSASSLDRQLRGDLNYVDENTDSTDRQTTTLSASRQSLWGQWRRTEGISILDEDFVVGSEAGQSTLLLGSLDLARTESDRQAVPRSGWRASVNVQAGAEALASDTDLVRAEAIGKIIWPLGTTARLLLKGQLGALWSGEFDRVPASLRFFAGGDRTIRGFDYNELGPQDADGEPLGGEFLAVAGVEVDWPLREGWRIATFIDAGNAFGAGVEDIAWSYGVGLRWLTPVGPLRLDLASAGSESGSPLRLHFSAGPDL